MKIEELLDIVNEKDEVIGQATRSDCHNNPKLIHRVAHCWILNSKGQFLWQQRSMLKKDSPGQWDMSCGGHIPAGESVKDGLLRELNEELGIKDVSPVLVEKYIAGNEKQTEMIYLYFVFFEKPTDIFVLQKEEVEQVKWFDFDEALTQYFNHEIKATSWIITQLPKIYQFVFKKHQSRVHRIMPDVIKNVGFDFNWSEEKVWALKLPVEDMSIKELEWHFDIPFWFTPGGYYDLKPRTVIEQKDDNKQEYERTMKADLSHPLDIMYWKNSWLLLDGLHRLVKAYILGQERIKVRK